MSVRPAGTGVFYDLTVPGAENYAAEGMWHHNSGKSWTGSHTLAEWILADPEPGEWGIVAPIYADAWSVCVEGEAGILAAFGTNTEEVKRGKSELVEYWHRSFAEIKMRSGHIIRVASAEDGGLRIQGKNLKGAWCDEIGLWESWKTTWDESLKYAVRKGRSQIVATGTPKKSRKARELIRRLLAEPTVRKSRLRTLDNRANLSESFFEEVVGAAKGTRLEQQELEGVLLDDVEGALWTADGIGAYRVDQEPDLIRVVVAVDPAVSNEEDSDETGIVVVGEAAGGHGFVLADYSMRGTPDQCMRKAVWAYHHHSADRVIGEANNGGDYIGSLLATVDPNVPYEKVIASRGKRVRAEPVSALYEQGRVHHVGVHTMLEEQMVSWVPSDPGDSPDRVDALCLVAGTPVLTARGEVPIESVLPGDLAWTRQGWKPVTAAGLTRRDADVLTIGLSDGRSLTGTPDHPVWTENRGWTRMDALVWGDMLSGWKNPRSASSTRESGTSATRTGSSAPTGSTTTPLAAAAGIPCTATSGGITTLARKSRPAGTSTTMTAIRSTTTPPTSCSHPRLSMLRSMLPSFTMPGASGSIPSGTLLPSGTAVPKASHGTGSTASAPGRAARPGTLRPALNAAKSSCPGSTSQARMSATARAAASTVPASISTWRRSPAPSALASSSVTATRSAPSPAPVHVVRSTAAGRRDVYDLTVAGAHEFTAAGVIVHNCWGVAALRGLTSGSWLQAYGVIRCGDCGKSYPERLGECPSCHPRAPGDPVPVTAQASAPEPQAIGGWASAYGDFVRCPQCSRPYDKRRHQKCPSCTGGMLAYLREHGKTAGGGFGGMLGGRGIMGMMMLAVTAVVLAVLSLLEK